MTTNTFKNHVQIAGSHQMTPIVSYNDESVGGEHIRNTGKETYRTCHPCVTVTNEGRYLALLPKKTDGTQHSDLSEHLSSVTGTTVSKQTVYRRLGQVGLYTRRPVRYIPHTETHCDLRLAWSRNHVNTTQQWAYVMPSDDFRFSLWSDSRQTLIWRASPVTTGKHH
ncbi:transposable element Tcb1 transposase [Trichonephila clavipes]|nr:transposable element Tcb1 transposase [Trichonephila clavipes]